MRLDTGGKSIKLAIVARYYDIAIKHWSDRCAEDECASRDTGVQRSKINK